MTTITTPQYTLHLGDCRDFMRGMAAGSVVTVTDPPYGIALRTDNSRFSGGQASHIARRGNGVGPAGGKPIIGDEKPFDPSFLVGFGRHQIIWGWNNFPDKLPAGACLVWIKRYDEAFGSFLSDAETAWMSKGRGVYCRRDLSNNAIANERQHPTQKPLALMRWCIELVSAPGDIIFDPFMGSGTTGVAALQLGRRFIGCELDPGYFAISQRRIEQAAAQPLLITPQRETAEQTTLPIAQRGERA